MRSMEARTDNCQAGKCQNVGVLSCAHWHIERFWNSARITCKARVGSKIAVVVALGNQLYTVSYHSLKPTSCTWQNLMTNTGPPLLGMPFTPGDDSGAASTYISLSARYDGCCSRPPASCQLNPTWPCNNDLHMLSDTAEACLPSDLYLIWGASPEASQCHTLFECQ